MIITLTPDPAVDQTIVVDKLERGTVNRFTTLQLEPAGKGINVARMAQRIGWPACAFGFLGGQIGRLAEEALDGEGVLHHVVQVPGQTLELRERGIAVVVISLGPDGAICGSGQRIWRAVPPPVERHSTVGSGDSFVAGLAVALPSAQDLVEGSRLGTAGGAAPAAAFGTAIGDAVEVQRLKPKVQIEELS